MNASNRHAAQGLGSILDIAEARSREVDRELRRAESLVFAAEEGAYTPRLQLLTATASAASPETASSQPGLVEFLFGDGGFRSGMWTGLGLGICIGLGAALVILVGSQVVIGWFS